MKNIIRSIGEMIYLFVAKHIVQPLYQKRYDASIERMDALREVYEEQYRKEKLFEYPHGLNQWENAKHPTDKGEVDWLTHKTDEEVKKETEDRAVRTGHVAKVLLSRLLDEYTQTDNPRLPRFMEEGKAQEMLSRIAYDVYDELIKSGSTPIEIGFIFKEVQSMLNFIKQGVEDGTKRTMMRATTATFGDNVLDEVPLMKLIGGTRIHRMYRLHGNKNANKKDVDKQNSE